MRNPTLRIILIVTGIVLVSGYLVFTLLKATAKSGDLVCNRLDINLVDSSRVQLISNKEIIRTLQTKQLYPVGKSLKNIDTEAIENVLEQNPMLKRVECYKTPSGTVRLLLVQRTPKFRVMGTAENYYVDLERNTMPVSTEYAAFVPVVSGRVTKTLAKGELFDFITFIEKNAFWSAQIEQIYVNNNQTIELVPRVGSGVILLGTLVDYERKLNKLQKLYTKGFSEIGWNRYAYIDLRYKDQVVCTKR